MPTLIAENVPLDVYDLLQKRAAGQQRSLPEETLLLLREVLGRPTLHLETLEVRANSAPALLGSDDLGTTAEARERVRENPAPALLVSSSLPGLPLPRLPQFISSEEICAPFDLPRSSQGELVIAVEGGPRLPDSCADLETESRG